jgi:pilus assembly protein CpaB
MLRAILICLVLVTTLAAGGIVWIAMSPPPTTAPPTAVATAPEAPQRAAFLAAARPLRAGTLVRAEDLTAVQLDLAAAPPGALRDSREARAEKVGAMVRRSMPVGEVLLPQDLLRPGERGFLAAVLAPGKRAFSVSVDAVTGAAGLIWPGDRVDLLLTQALNDEAVLPHRRVFGETVLTDVRVIAIDQAIMQGAVGDAPDADRQSRTVTLEVSARQAEMAAVATRLGRLALLLRSAESGGPTDTGAQARLPGTTAVDPEPAPAQAAQPPVPVFGGDISPGLRQGRPDSAPVHTMQIFLGNQRREEFRF